jgi:hypothetical protein
MTANPLKLCDWINKTLAKSEHHQTHISTTRWTNKGNLVITGSHTNTMYQLLAASSIIKNIFFEAYSNSNTPLTSLPIQANIKWSKLLINGVPTGVSNAWGTKNPNECHTALTLENPTYAHLQITQKPSWVRPPDQYTIGSASSLIVAFEDLDGSKSRALLASHQLYIFSIKAKVHRWKKTPPKPAQPTPSSGATTGTPHGPIPMELSEPLKQVATKKLSWFLGDHVCGVH